MGVKGRGGSRVNSEVHGFKGLISRRSKKVSKVLTSFKEGFPLMAGASKKFDVSKVHGFQG